MRQQVSPVTIEQILGVIVEAKVSPLEQAIRALAANVESLRRSLPPSLLSPAQAAEFLGVSHSTVRRRIRDGSLPVVRLGRSLRISVTKLHGSTDEEINRLVAEFRQAVPPTSSSWNRRHI